MTGPPSVAYCRRVMREHARSFYFATRLLPVPKRRAIEALYAFFRCVDDAADEGNAAREERRERLHAFRGAVLAMISRSPAGAAEPWFDALARAFERYALDPQPLFELIDGCES
ncbi:MAG TPA: squalene/phytoene synthase family protein, partial [Candidatus Tumulicola sp.]